MSALTVGLYSDGVNKEKLEELFSPVKHFFILLVLFQYPSRGAKLSTH